MGTRDDLDVRPVTADRWDDLVALFGERGAFGGCWCMYWRVTSADFAAEAGAGLRQRLRRLVVDGREPGLLAYEDGEPVGWVAVAPRPEFGRMQRSPTVNPVDDTPTWMVNCFYIDRRHRRAGVARQLLDAAVAFARARGAEAVEGVPVDTRGTRRESAGLYTGTLAMFEEAGFVEIARRRQRPIVRQAAPR
ncbi:MAG: GNAT family N-acetyltransferase [Acidimicrobiales bacterium]